MVYKLLSTSTFVCAAWFATAQPMQLYDCIRQALENNYSIKIAENNRDIAENNVSYAPFLPAVTATGKQEQSTSKGVQTLAATSMDATVDAKTSNLNAGVSLNWRLFDGLAMFAQHNKQKKLFDIGEQEKQIAMENLIAQVCYEYYNVIILQNRLGAALYSLILSTERYNQAMERYALGSSSGLDLRQAKIDLNADSSVMMTHEESLQNAYIRLNTLMNAPLTNSGYINDSIVLMPRIDRETLTDNTLKYNRTLMAARLGIKITEEDLKLMRALRYPTLDFNTGYNYSRTETPSAAVTYNRVNGFNWGFTVSWTLFNGFENSRKIKNAKLAIKGNELNYQQTENSIISNLTLTYNTYEKNLQMINFENESVETAYQTLDAAMSRYKLGGLSGIEFREYQKKYLEAVERKYNALYQAKLSEINLRLMSGELITGAIEYE